MTVESELFTKSHVVPCTGDNELGFGSLIVCCMFEEPFITYVKLLYRVIIISDKLASSTDVQFSWENPL